MENNKNRHDEIERRRLQEYIFNLEEKEEMAEDLAIEHEHLKHTQELLNAILSATTHGMCLIKKDAFIWCNKGLTDIFGWEHDELVGRTIEILFPEKDEHARINTLVYRELSETGNTTFDYDFVHKNGERIACLVTGRPLDESDVSRGFIFSFTDFSKRKRAEEALKKTRDELEERVKERTKELHSINKQLNLELTERKRAQESLRKSEDKYRLLYEESKKAEEVYRSLIHSSADAIIIYDMEGIPNYISPSFTLIFGWTMDEVEGKPIPFLPESEKATTMKIINDLIENETPYHGYETKRFSKDGRLLDVSISASRYSDHEGKPAGMLVVIRDISERKQLEAQFQQAQKMEAIATLAGGVAHEFNNALMGIMGNIELLKMDLPEDERRDKYFEAMKGSGHRMSRLTDQLLAYAQGGKYQPKNLKVDDFVIETLPILQHDLNPEVRVETHFPKDVSYIKADHAQMQMVLSAILANSNEAIEDEGLVRITAENKDVDEDFTKQHPGLKPGTYVCLTIEDDGKGMDEETKGGIFEPFFTTKFQGRGMGMAAVYGIVKNHDGWIFVDSELGKGTTVRIYLPAISAESKEQGAKPVKQPEIELNTGEGTILMIEDEDVVIEVTQAMLEMLGYRVMSAKTGKEAIRIAETFDGRIDLALLDIKLPDMEGGKVYPVIMKARPNLKVIVFSGYSIEGPARKILNAGAQDFIQKPFSLATLSEKLKEVLEGK
jgi:two-component system, cell cycle sensor histidine kinase and response regulator CckA